MNFSKFWTTYLLMFLLGNMIIICSMQIKYVIPNYNSYEIISTAYQYLVGYGSFSNESVSRTMVLRYTNRLMDTLICVFFVYGLNLIVQSLEMSWTMCVRMKLYIKLMFFYLYKGAVPNLMETVLIVSLINDLHELLLVDEQFRPLTEYLQTSYAYIGSVLQNALSTCSDFLTVGRTYNDNNSDSDSDSDSDDPDHDVRQVYAATLLNCYLNHHHTPLDGVVYVHRAGASPPHDEQVDVVDNPRADAHQLDEYVFEEEDLFDYDKDYDEQITFEKAQKDMIKRIDKFKTI